MHYARIAQLRTADQFRAYLLNNGIDLAFDETMMSGADAPLAQPYRYKDFVIGNRFAVLPMEGWDGTPDGHPSEMTMRRWQRFGISGAKLIWGGEAVAVRHDGRANPNQLVINEQTVGDLGQLRETLIKAHQEHHGRADDLLIGLQLTHSGRFSRPAEQKRHEPRTLYRHPLLDRRLGIRDDSTLMSDDDIARLIDDFIHAAGPARRARAPPRGTQQLARPPEPRTPTSPVAQRSTDGE